MRKTLIKGEYSSQMGVFPIKEKDVENDDPM